MRYAPALKRIGLGSVVFQVFNSYTSTVWAAPKCDQVYILRANQSSQAQLAQDRVIPFSPRVSSRYEFQSQIEQALAKQRPPLSPHEQLLFDLSQLRKQNPEWARRIDQAWDKKRRGRSLMLDLSHLPSFMGDFIRGPFMRVVGSRGVSEPFVQLRAIDGQTLEIIHAGDAYPMRVKWSADVTSIKSVRSEKMGEQVYQVLELPQRLTSLRELNKEVEPRWIWALISGSAMHPYIPADSPWVRMSRALHDGQLHFDRPTQKEAKEVRALLRQNPELRAKIQSLLFVAPTATGKTRVLGDALVDFIQSYSAGPKRLAILATKTPDLTHELARNISQQLHQSVSLNRYRILQWGGEGSESLSLSALSRLIENSSVPVILITSYPTILARSKESSEGLSALSKHMEMLLVDEAHNATGESVTSLFQEAKKQKAFIFGVTASPITRTVRTTELFDASFWAGTDKVGLWAQKHLEGKTKLEESEGVLEWVRMYEQYHIAKNRGEINASDPQIFRPEENGFNFSSIFRRGEGSSSYVDLAKLKLIWPRVAGLIEGHGPGVIHTHPRDADPVAQTLSELSGKNFISLQRYSAEKRVQIYEAFRSGGLFEGRPVDAIVGSIREGLDFPQAGWYLNFKKYVKFPEIIQGPGRVVRIAHNKLNPVILFFGEQVDRVSFAAVKEFVMSRLGSLPRSLPEGRLYTGARRQGQRAEMIRAIDQLNTAMEAFLRTQSHQLKALGDLKKPNLQVLGELRALLHELRYSGEVRELKQAIIDFIAQAYTYPVFNGQLKSSWAAAEKIQKSDAFAAEFRSYFGNLGPVPRKVLEEMDLNPINVTEVAQIVNRFVQVHGENPLRSDKSSEALKQWVKHGLQISPQGLWRRMDPEARSQLSQDVARADQVTLEQKLNEWVKDYQKLPDWDLGVFLSRERQVDENLSARLYHELNEAIRTGRLNVEELSPQVQKELAQSELLVGQFLAAKETLERVLQARADGSPDLNSYFHRLAEQGLLKIDYLRWSEELGVLRVMDELKKKDSRLQQLLRDLEKELEQTAVSQGQARQAA